MASSLPPIVACPPLDWDRWADVTNRALDVLSPWQALEAHALGLTNGPFPLPLSWRYGPAGDQQRWLPTVDGLYHRLRGNRALLALAELETLDPVPEPFPSAVRKPASDVAPWVRILQAQLSDPRLSSQHADPLYGVVLALTLTLPHWGRYPALAMAAQVAAAAEFGLPRPRFTLPPGTSWGSTDPATLKLPAMQRWRREVAAYQARLPAQLLAALRAYLQSVYERTQDVLAAERIPGLLLWRGQAHHAGARAFSRTSVALRPISLATPDFESAYRYARDAGEVVSMLVPRERVLATCHTGPCYGYEREAWVLGGPTSAWSLTWRHAPSNPEAGVTERQFRAWAVQAAAERRALRFPADLPSPRSDPRFADAAPGVLDRYQPDPAWWLARPWGPHGVTHCIRVLVWAEQVARWLLSQGVPVDLEIVRWAAILHDCRRQFDGTDDGHGNRGAAFALAQRRGILAHLTSAQVEAVARCIAWHVPDDSHSPSLTPELVALKDADSLDRVRFGPEAFDARYLRCDALRARDVHKLATMLANATMLARGPDAWACTRWVAWHGGLWPEAEPQSVAAPRARRRAKSAPKAPTAA